jgi:Na+/proline symporter
MQFVVPPYASRGYKLPEDWGNIISHALSNAVVCKHSEIYPVFKIIPILLLTNVTGLAFCMMAPVYVGLLTLYWPRVNISTLRATSLVGLIIGLYNMYANFGIDPGRHWWNGVLHIPLLVISLYGLIISLKRTPVEAQRSENMVPELR